jgi:hypothetical protein
MGWSGCQRWKMSWRTSQLQLAEEAEVAAKKQVHARQNARRVDNRGMITNKSKKANRTASEVPSSAGLVTSSNSVVAVFKLPTSPAGRKGEVSGKFLEIVPVEIAAEILGVTERRVRQYCEQGRLGVRFGKRGHLITMSELREFAKRERKAGSPGKAAVASRVLKRAGEVAGEVAGLDSELTRQNSTLDKTHDVETMGRNVPNLERQ